MPGPRTRGHTGERERRGRRRSGRSDPERGTDRRRRQGFWGSAAAQTDEYEELRFDDFSDTSGLTLNGATALVSTTDGAVMRLTPALGGQSGSMFSTQTLDLDEPEPEQEAAPAGVVAARPAFTG